MQPSSIREKLGPKYASVPTDKLMENPDFYRDLLRYVEISVYHHSYIVVRVSSVIVLKVCYLPSLFGKEVFGSDFLEFIVQLFPPQILIVQLTLNPKTPNPLLPNRGPSPF